MNAKNRLTAGAGVTPHGVGNVINLSGFKGRQPLAVLARSASMNSPSHWEGVRGEGKYHKTHLFDTQRTRRKAGSFM